MRAYFAAIDDGDLLGETFLGAVIGAVIGGYLWMCLLPACNLALHVAAALSGEARDG